MRVVWLRFAARNIVRHRRRSVLVLLAMAGGLFVLIFLKGLQDGFVNERLAQGLGMMIGHARIEPAADRASGAVLEDVAVLLEAVGTDPAVRAAAPRVRGQALARGPAGATGVALLGVDPAREMAATELAHMLVDGSFLAHGTNDETPPAVIGARLAETLAVGIGDRVTLLAESGGGSLMEETFRVSGLFETGGQALDERFVYLPRADAGRLLALAGEATEIVLRMDEPRHAPEIAARLADLPALADTRVRSWHETAPEVLTAMEMLRVMERLRNLVLFVLVGLGVLNAVAMSVFERRQEFGVLMALGLRSRAVLAVMAWEVGLLALAGIALGIGAGWSVTDLWLGQRGLDIFALGARLPGALEGTSVIYPTVGWTNVLSASTWVGALALLVLAWPARAILRLDPAVALRGRG